MKELKDILDDASKELAKLDEKKFRQWASYLLEAIDEEYGEKGLHYITELLDERFRNGRW
jgi:hypothetical protein